MSQAAPSSNKQGDKPSGGNAKGKSSEPKKDRKHKSGSDKPKPSKPPAPREAPKKLFRIVIRKLPFKDFNEEEFVKCLDRVCAVAELGLVRDSFSLEHFSAGKISRKRGQVFSSGFVSVSDEVQYWKFLANCPAKVPFLEGVEESGQPEVSIAPNQKAFKLKDRTDRHVGTFETDPLFLAFAAKLAAPVEKLPSAETQLDHRKSEISKEDLIKNNPLLKYMREKAEKKLAERKLLRKGSSKGLVVTSVLKSSRGKGGVAGGVSGKAEKSERGERGEKGEKSSRGSRREAKAAREGDVEGPGKKPSSRGGRSERGERSEKPERAERGEGRGGGSGKSSRGGGGGGAGDVSAVFSAEGVEIGTGGSGGGGGGGGNERRGARGSGRGGGALAQGDGAAAPQLAVPKFTIAKRNAPLPSANISTSHDTHTTHTPIAPHMAPYSARDSHSSGVHGVVEGVGRMSVSAGGASGGGGGEGEKRSRGRGGKGRGEGGSGGDVRVSGDARMSGDARVSGDGSGGRGEGKGGRGGERGGDRSSGTGNRGGRGGGRGDGPPPLHVPSL